MKRYHLLAFAWSIAFALPAIAAAAGLPPTIVPQTCTGVDCKCGDLIKIAENILNAGIYFAVFLSALLFAWAGWKMISGKSTGESGSIAEAKKILWNVIVGLVIMLAAWLLVDTLMKTLVSSSVWTNICKF